MQVIEKVLDPKSSSGVSLKEEKKTILFNWLREFKFTDFDIVASLFNTNKSNVYRFIRGLEKEGYIVLFKNSVIGNNYNLIAPTQMAINYLKDLKIAISDERVTHYSKYEKNLTAWHHLELQRYLSKNLDKYTEIVWEANIKIDKNLLKPDCIVRLKTNNNKIAVEYERWSKTKARIYVNFYSHFQNIKKGLYAGVIYVFEDDNDRNKYVNMFKEEEWPMYRYRSGDGKPMLMSRVFNASSVTGLDKVFIFKNKD